MFPSSAAYDQHCLMNPVYAALQFAQPGRWYINPELRLRVWCRKVVGHLVYLAEHPGADPVCDDVWKVVYFHQAFVPCEDLRHAHALGSCPATCPTCFHPRINRVVDAVIAKHEAKLRTKARALYDRQQAAARARQRQHKQSVTALALLPARTRKGR